MRILTVAIMAVIAMAAWGGNLLVVTGGEGHPGDEVRLTLSLSATDTVSAVQIKLPLSRHTAYVEGSCQLAADRCADHTVTATSDGDTLHVIVYSLGLLPLKGSDGELCTLRLRMGKKPATYAITPTVLLSNAQGKALECEAQGGTVTLLSPELEVTTPTVSYGRVPIRSRHTAWLSLRNTGNEPLVTSSFDFSNKDFSVASQEVALQPGEMQAVQVVYEPWHRADSVRATLSIASNAVNGTRRATLCATPYSVNELHVEQAQGVSDEVVEMRLRVNNMEPLVAVQAQFALSKALEYVPGSFAPAQRAGRLTATSSCSKGRLTVLLYSTALDTIDDNDGVAATFKLRLKGRSGWYSLYPDSVVLANATAENMTSAVEGAYVVIQSPKISGSETLSLGHTPITRAAEATYAVRNQGETPLTVEKVAFLDDGFTVADPLPMLIAAGQQATLRVRYAPKAEGEYATTMNVYSNDPDRRLVQVAVQGSIFEPDSLTLAATGTSDGTGCDVAVGLNNYTANLTALQFQLQWPATLRYASVEPAGRLAQHSVSVTPLTDSTALVIAYSMGNITIEGNEGELMKLRFTTAGEAHSFDFGTVAATQIIMSNAKGENKASATTATCLIPQSWLLGDVNNDGKVNVADYAATALRAVGGDPKPFVFKAADVNSDGIINVSDVVGVANIALQQK